MLFIGKGEILGGVFMLVVGTLSLKLAGLSINLYSSFVLFTIGVVAIIAQKQLTPPKK